jgi:hypothetical protein
MKNRMALIVIILAWITITLMNCSHQSTNPENRQAQGVIYQVRGCQSELSKNLASSDSCFSYQFEKTLHLEFCLTGNCCPDSNRFWLSNKLRNDTIFVVAADTAAQLCRCICIYKIHAEFDELPLDHYVFYCMREDYSSQLVHYREHVYRQQRL